MESRQTKISDPDFVRLAVSEFDQFWAEQKESGKFSISPRDPNPEISTIGATNAASGGIDAADLLGYFYAEVSNAAGAEGQHASFMQSGSSDPDEKSVAQTGGETDLREGTRNDYSSLNPAASALQADVTLAEASEILGLDRRSILGLVTIGHLHAETDNRGQLMISGRSLQAYWRSGGTIRPSEIPKPEPGTASFDAPPLASDSLFAAQESPAAAEPETTRSADGPDAAVRVDVYELVAKLSEAQSQLESASYRIGFLESELNANEQKIRLLPDLQSQENRLAALERENFELKLRLDKLERGPLGVLTRFLSLLMDESPRKQLRQPARGQSVQEPDQYYHRRSRKEFY